MCRGVDGVRCKANKSSLSVSIPQPKSEPEIQRCKVEPVTRKDQILRSESLLPSPLEQLLFLNTRFLWLKCASLTCWGARRRGAAGVPSGWGARVPGGRRGLLCRGASLGGIWDRGALVGRGL